MDLHLVRGDYHFDCDLLCQVFLLALHLSAISLQSSLKFQEERYSSKRRKIQPKIISPYHLRIYSQKNFTTGNQLTSGCLK